MIIYDKILDEELLHNFKADSNNEKDMFLLEGLVVDEYKKTVRLTDETDDGIDFSNKRYIHYKYRLDDNLVNVISIFKRTALEGELRDIDGNPFIYALKEKDGWKFDITDEQIIHYIRRFLEICNTIDKKYDTIVVVPSSHDINARFMKVIAERVEAKDCIADMFMKSTKQSALESIELDEIWEYCEDKYPANSVQYNADRIVREIKRAFQKMDGKYFEAKKVPKEYIRFIKEIVSYREGFSVKDAYDKLAGKSVLVLDDTISTGASISACVRTINTFGPKKLDVITLLSKKFKK